MKRHFKPALYILILLAMGCSIISAQTLLTGHTDINFKYDTPSGQWEASLVHGGTFEEPDTETPLDQAGLPAEDQPSDTGDRFIAPSGFEFTGVTAGNPIWILPQTDRGYTWPGIRNESETNIFRAYNPDDPRVTAVPQRWINITLKSLDYAGKSTGPVNFSAWQIQSSVPVVWMATSDGIDSGDTFLMTPNGHAHLNFGFSDLGIYRVGFQPSAILDSTGETVTGDTEYITFAIGTLATWLADHYGGLDLVDDQVTGSESDSDGDQAKLIEEYAFNMNPTIRDRHALERDSGTSGLPTGWVAESGGVDRLHLQMVCRKSATNPQIQYIVEFNDDLTNEEGWAVATPLPPESINSTWERVTVIDTESIASKAKRFARVRVIVQESITY